MLISDITVLVFDRPDRVSDTKPALVFGTAVHAARQLFRPSSAAPIGDGDGDGNRRDVLVTLGTVSSIFQMNR